MPISTITLYKVRYFDKMRKKWTTTGYRMERHVADERFADTEYEILEATKEERTGDPERSHTGSLSTPR